MKKMIGITARIFSLLIILLLAACSDAAPDLDKNTNALPKGSVTFFNNQGVFVQPIGGEPRLLAKQASFPRWSPDGKFIAAVRGKEILEIHVDSGRIRALTRAPKPRAVSWSPDGKRILFTDDRRVLAVDRSSLDVSLVVKGFMVRELDLHPNQKSLITTVRDGGVKIRQFDLRSGSSVKLADGCSASYSPSGQLVSKLIDSHRGMNLLDPISGKILRRLKAPGNLKYDNHFWSNHSDWIVGEVENGKPGIILIHAESGQVKRLTEGIEARRGDVYLAPDMSND